MGHVRSMGLLALLIICTDLHAQAPIDFHRVNMANFAISDTSRVWSADLIGTAHAECVSQNGGTLDICDFHTGAAPAHATFPIGANVRSIDFGDLDGDGNLDFVALTGSGTSYAVNVALNPMSGVFSQTFASTSTVPIHAADLDGDGDLDLVCGGQRWLNAGNGTFGAPITFTIGAANPTDVAPGDVDGDGDQDLIVTFIGNSPSGPGLVTRIHRQNADHSFTLFAGQLIVPGAVSTMTNVADVNGDGRADIVYVARNVSSNFSEDLPQVVGTWLGLPSLTFTATPVVEMSSANALPLSLPIADLDGDGRKDVIVAANNFPDGTNYATLTVLMSNAQGALVPATGRSLADALYSQTLSNTLGVTTLDEDLDGDADLLVGPPSGFVTLYRNDSTGASPITAAIAQSQGPDIILSDLNELRLSLTFINAADRQPMSGHLVTLTAPLPGGGTFTATHTMARRTSFEIAAAGALTSFPVTVSTSAGTTQTFTVHRQGVLANVTGGGQSAPVGTPLSTPFAATVHDGTGQPLQGIAVEFVGNNNATTPTPIQFTDVNGHVSFTAVAGPAAGGSAVKLMIVANESFVLTPITTAIADSMQVDTPASASICALAPFTVSGHVYTPSGAPHAGQAVTLVSSSMANPSILSTVTANDGSFAFSVTPPYVGTHTYSVCSVAASPYCFNGTLQAGGNFAIVIDSGADQVLCPSAPPQPIVGHITNTCGGPVAGITVAVSSPTIPIMFTPLSVITGPAGTFSFQPTFTIPPTAAVSGSIAISAYVAGQSISAATTMTVANFGMQVSGGDQQVATAGQTFLSPVTVALSSPCSSIAGRPVTFSSTSAGVTFTPFTAITDGNGFASTTVSTTTSTSASVVIHATFGDASTDFHLFVRRLSVVTTPAAMVITYFHEHANVPLVLAADSPAVLPLTTPWGVIRTSILSPGPFFGVIDGLGIFGSIDPGMNTSGSGSWARVFQLPPASGLTFIGQMYGYDLNAAYPYDYIVSNPVTFAF